MVKVELSVDLDSGTPVDEQLRLLIERLVNTGDSQPGNRLPTVRQLAIDLEMNANAVARIMKQLETAGYVFRQDGIGQYSIDLRALREERRERVFNV